MNMQQHETCNIISLFNKLLLTHEQISVDHSGYLPQANGSEIRDTITRIWVSILMHSLTCHHMNSSCQTVVLFQTQGGESNVVGIVCPESSPPPALSKYSQIAVVHGHSQYMVSFWVNIIIIPKCTGIAINHPGWMGTPFPASASALKGDQVLQGA